jgi:hypothetical protein
MADAGAVRRGRDRAPAPAISAALAAVLLVVGVVVATAAPASAAGSPVSFRQVPVASWRVDGVGYAVLKVGDVVYVGGSFTTARDAAGGQATGRSNLAAFDASSGALIGSFVANTNGIVRDLAYAGGRLYVGGSFTTVNGTSRSRLAAVDPSSGAVLGWRADVNSNVYALSIGGGQLFVAGSFSRIGGANRSRAAAVDLASAAVGSYAPAVNGTVNSIAVNADASRVYFGGAYTAVGSTATTNLTATDATGRVLPITWRSLSGPALKLELEADGSRLAVGVGGYANQGAWYDTSTGQRLWYQRCDGDAQAIHIVAGSVFTGFHDGCGGDTTIHLTSNVSSSGARDTSFQPAFDRYWGVRDISGDTSALVVAGDFTRISGVAVQGFAIFPNPSAPPPTTTTTTTSTTTTTTTTTSSTSTTSTTSTTTTTVPGGSGGSYRDAVLADSPSLYWRLDEAAAGAVADSSGHGATGSYRSGLTYGATGALAGDPDTAVTSPGTSGIAYANASTAGPTTYSLEVWFRSTSTSGGKLIGLEDVQVGWGSRIDRQLYLTNAGRIAYGIVSGGTRRVVESPASYTDGSWHQVVATQDGGGMRLYVDGTEVAAGPTAVPDASSGYWRVGGGNLTGWQDAPRSSAVAGTIDEVAVYPAALSPARVAAHLAAAR